jgi:outer membrane receptor protein involved in Fe transport
MTRKWGSEIGGLALVGLTLVVTPAPAQRVIEEVVVFATKREESLSDVPIAVSAFSADQLLRAGVQDVRDLQQLSPSLLLTSTQSETAGTTARIRGVGTTGDNLGLESSVAVFVDGVYRNRNSVALTDIGAIERVEVLRGPQGTLFGKNATAGLIQIITPKPDLEEFGGFVEGFAGNKDQYRVSAGVTGPLFGQTGFRLDGTWNERDGFVDDIASGEDYNDRDRYLLRGQLYSEIGDSLSLRLIGDYSDRDETCCAAVTKIAGPTAGIINNGLGPAGIPPLGTIIVPPDSGDRDMTSNSNRGYDSEVEEWGLSLEANWDFGPGTLTSISSYRDWDADRSQDIDYTDADILYRLNGSYSNEFETFTQELRYAWSVGSFDFMVGAYYVDEELDVLDGIRSGSDYESYANAIILASGETTTIPAPGFTDGNGAITDQFEQDTDSWAVFTHNRWQVTNEVAFTLGLRYTQEDKELDATLIANNPACLQTAGLLGGGVINPVDNALLLQFACLPIFSPLVDAPNNPILGNIGAYNEKRSDDELTGTFIAEYAFDGDWLGYASFARGYKAGGFNLDRAGLDGLGVLFQQTPSPKALEFNKETVNSYEVGLKGSLFDSKLRMDMTVFYADYDDFQLNTFTGTNFIVTNVDGAESVGFEINGAGVVTEWLTLSGGIAYTDATYDEDLFDPNDPGLSDLSGETLTNAPEWIVTAAGDFEQPVFGSLLLFAHLDMRFVDDHNTGSDLNPNKEQSHYYVWNGNIGIAADDGFWEVELWGRNLFDKDFDQVVIDAPLQEGTFATFLADPRTYGVRARLNF